MAPRSVSRFLINENPLWKSFLQHASVEVEQQTARNLSCIVPSTSRKVEPTLSNGKTASSWFGVCWSARRGKLIFLFIILFLWRTTTRGIVVSRVCWLLLEVPTHLVPEVICLSVCSIKNPFPNTTRAAPPSPVERPLVCSFSTVAGTELNTEGFGAKNICIFNDSRRSRSQQLCQSGTPGNDKVEYD